MIEIKKQIAEALSAAAGGAIDAAAVQDALEYPPNADMGDLAFPCFRLGKGMRKAPPRYRCGAFGSIQLPRGRTCGSCGRLSQSVFE